MINGSKKYRTKIRIIGDILHAIKNSGRDGIIVSVLSRKAKLAHYPTINQCKQLKNAGLIETTSYDGKIVFVITNKGLDFFKEYQEFQDLIEPLNLKY